MFRYWLLFPSTAGLSFSFLQDAATCLLDEFGVSLNEVKTRVGNRRSERLVARIVKK